MTDTRLLPSTADADEFVEDDRRAAVRPPKIGDRFTATFGDGSKTRFMVMTLAPNPAGDGLIIVAESDKGSQALFFTMGAIDLVSRQDGVWESIEAELVVPDRIAWREARERL